MKKLLGIIILGILLLLGGIGSAWADSKVIFLPMGGPPGGAGDVKSVGDCLTDACLDGTSDGGTYIAIYDGDSHKMTLGVADLGADVVLDIPAGLTTAEFAYIAGLTSDAQTQIDAQEAELDNSAGLLAALDDETGTGLSVFSIDPTYQSLTGDNLIITLEADASEDNADSWRVVINDSGNLDIESYSTGSWVDILQLNNDGSMTSGATDLPTITFNDSGNPGTDKEIAKITANFLSGADGAEDGSMMLNAMLAGSEVEWLKWDSDTEAITMGDSGTGEDLIFDFETAADNQVEVSSGSGLTEISLSALQFVTTGDIMGGINVSAKAGAYTVGTDDAHESYGTLFINTNVINATLPAVLAGMALCIVQEQGVTGIITIQPNTGDYIVQDGARGTAATDLKSSGAAVDKICVVGRDGTDWIATSTVGTWAE